MKCRYCGHEYGPEEMFSTERCPECGMPDAEETIGNRLPQPSDLKRQFARERLVFVAKAVPSALAAIICFWILVQVLATLWGVLLSAKNEKETAAKPAAYGAWAAYPHDGIARLLAGHDIPCSHMRWKSDVVHRGRFLLRCSRDGREWSEYRVDLNVGAIAGPFSPNRDND